MRNILNGPNIIIGKIKHFQTVQLIESPNLKQSIIIELEFNQIGTKLKADDFLNEIVSQIEASEVGGVD